MAVYQVLLVGRFDDIKRKQGEPRKTVLREVDVQVEGRGGKPGNRVALRTEIYSTSDVFRADPQWEGLMRLKGSGLEQETSDADSENCRLCGGAMKVITALDSYQHTLLAETTMFLAGGISGTPEWQQDMIALLADTSLILFNPRRPHFPMDDPTVAEAQIRWEFNHLRIAHAILFWFPKEIGMSYCALRVRNLVDDE